MKLLYWLVAAPLMVLAVLFAISNRGAIELGLWPFVERHSAPLFIVLFLTFAVGFLAGGFVAWIGGHRHRVRARVAEHRVNDQTREIAGLRRRLEEADAADGPSAGQTSSERALVPAGPR